MAKLIVVAVRDRQIDAFMAPFCVPAAGAAIRGFQDELNRADPNNAMHRHPEDYDLYQLGYYDETEGTFTNEKKQLAIGTQLITKGN